MVWCLLVHFSLSLITVGYGVAGNSCGLPLHVRLQSDISMFTGLLIVLTLHLPSHRGSSFRAVGTNNQTRYATQNLVEDVCLS